MKRRSTPLLGLLLLLVLLAPAVSEQALGITAIVVGSVVGLGFSPSSVQPTAIGVPVYTQGDNLWVESYYTSTVEVRLLYPSGAGASPLVELGPGQLIQLHTFGPNDTSGRWALSVASPSSAFVPQTVQVAVSAPDSSLVPSQQGDNITGNTLVENFAIPPTHAYDIQACSAGASIGPTVSFGASGSTNGTLEVSLGQNASQLTFPQTAAPITVWLELYSQYTYSVGGGTVSQYLLAASTQPVTLSTPASAQGPQSELLPLALQMPLRSGRFDLRMFERTSAGLSVQSAEYLRTRAGYWISLGGCTSLDSVYSNAFTTRTNLDSSNSTWPRHLITMYALNGTESYSECNLTGSESVIRLRVLPNGGPLAGVAIAASAPGSQLRGWAAYNGAVYILSGSYPSNVSISLSFSGITTQTLIVPISAPYSSKSLSVPAGALAASVSLNGEPFGNATLSVSAPGGDPAVVAQSGEGSVSILLPPNNYTLTVSYGGNTVTQDFAIQTGLVTAINVELNPPGFPVTLAALAALAAAGAIANIVIWRRYLERRRISI